MVWPKDLARDLAVEELANGPAQHRDARGAAHQDDLVHVGLLNANVLQAEEHGIQQVPDILSAEVLEVRPRHVARVVEANDDC